MSAAYQVLRNVPLFADLPDEDLQAVASVVKSLELPAGEDLFPEGSMGNEAYFIEEGELEVLKTSNNREMLITVRGPGDVIGEIALVADTPRTATVRARTDVKLVCISREQLRELLHINPSVAASMFDIVLARWQATQGQLRHSEKMAQLGTLTAGIAHELNNPAAAVRRGASQLEGSLFDGAGTFMHIVREDLNREQQDKLQTYIQRVQAKGREVPILDPIVRSDREGELEVWLDDHDVPDGWEMASTMVDLGLETADLDDLAATYQGELLGTIIRWLNGNYEIINLLTELQQGAERISEIVKALKSYTYLDQAPIVRYDIHRGIDDTLLILRHKLKTIPIRREYDENLPEIDAHGSELNQVWTNLLDNAVDAIDDSGRPDGEIILRTRRDGKWAVVEVEDNGPGMSPEVVNRIFEPFFTTKPVGLGTGLGMDISFNIVVNRHAGDIKVDSEPGRTKFEVWLPVHQAE